MKKLQEAIETRGRVISSEVLKTDTFLNHAIDTELMDEIGQAFARAFEKEGITKVMTIESGGIAPAYSAALHLHVPLVFCKSQTHYHGTAADGHGPFLYKKQRL